MKNLTILITLLLLAVSPALAATATPSATPTTTNSTPSGTMDIQDKIKSLVQENLSATESDLKQKINLQTLVGYVGTIKSINTENLTLTTKDGSLMQITTGNSTTITKLGATIKFSSLALSDKIIVIGTLLKDDIILAKRIQVVKDEPILITSGTVYAKISAIDIKAKTISLIVNNQEVTYLLTRRSTIKLSELEEGQTIFAITKKFEEKDYLSTAKVIE